jgi:integrase
MLQWIDPSTGRRKSKSAGTADEKEAEDARVDMESDLNNGRYAEASRMPWERFRELFEAEYLPGCRANTRRNYRVMFDLFERVCNPSTLRGVSERTISAFTAGLRKLPGYKGSETMQPGSVKVRLQFLHTALRWAADQKLIPTCPRFPSVKVPKKLPQPVAPEAFERLLAKAEADPQLRVYLLCGWLAGLRLNEARLLEWEETDKAPWVDLARDRIILPAGFVKAVEDQWVPLDPALRRELEALPRHGRCVFRFDAIDGRGEREVCDITVASRVRKLAKAAGVKLTMKSLRKGFGCRYAGKVPAQVLQKLMRHSNISVTMDYYANVDDAVVAAVLGPQRNTSRNTQPGPISSEAQGDSVSSCENEVSKEAT